MAFESINPANGQLLKVIDSWDDAKLASVLTEVRAATAPWQATTIATRCQLMVKAGAIIRERQQALAQLITLEMGKLRREADAEVAKCAAVCDYYAEHGPAFLADEAAPSDADHSYIAHQPIGAVLAVMPWNFPLWQVFRFAAPALVAGNTALLKHASNVPQCAMAIEQVFIDAGFPDNTFRTLMIRASQVAEVIASPAVQAVTLTGSESAGRQVAACAGQNLKKSLLELGGSDAFIVLDDADLELTVRGAISSRFLNAGQSCIAAKRFIVDEHVADTFIERFKHAAQALKMGDPQHQSTTLAPMARRDLRDELHQQVTKSVERGAQVVTGGARPDGDGAYYPATILDHVVPGMPAYEEELFGPVASIIRVPNAARAIEVANASPFGLGGSVWGRDRQRAETLARQVEAGACFVNGIVKSDPRLPFGGIKNSGYGRELYRHGMLEFINAKTIWIKDIA